MEHRLVSQNEASAVELWLMTYLQQEFSTLRTAVTAAFSNARNC